jgi:outer membrane biosynthesis protein TonB
MDAEQIVHDVSEKVRALISDAEQRAASIVRDAEQEAKTIRERAEVEGRERLAEVRKAFDELQGKLGAEVEPGPVIVPEPEPEPPPVPEPEPPPTPEPPDPAPEPEPPLIPEPTPPPDEATPPSAAHGGARSDDSAGARLVAMNMALEGRPRAEIVAKLEQDYAIDDPGAIVDQVLALAGK